MNAKLTEKLADTEQELETWVSAHRQRMETNTGVAIQACPGTVEIAVQVAKKPGFSLGFLVRWVTNWVYLYDFYPLPTSYECSDKACVLTCIQTVH